MDYRLNLHLQHSHPIGALVHDLVAPLPIQPPDKLPWKAPEVGSAPWAPALVRATDSWPWPGPAQAITTV